MCFVQEMTSEHSLFCDTGHSAWTKPVTLPRSDRAIPGTRPHSGRSQYFSISLSLSDMRQTESLRAVYGPGSRERGRLGSRAAPRRLESGVTSFQVSSQSLPASGAAGEYCVGQESRRVLCFKMSEFCDFLCDTLLVFAKMIAATKELMKSVKKEFCSINLL